MVFIFTSLFCIPEIILIKEKIIQNSRNENEVIFIIILRTYNFIFYAFFPYGPITIDHMLDPEVND